MTYFTRVFGDRFGASASIWHWLTHRKLVLWIAFGELRFSASFEMLIDRKPDRYEVFRGVRRKELYFGSRESYGWRRLLMPRS
jgi:hypothetical protein